MIELVAISPCTVVVPEIKAPPCTDKICEGEVVPIPTKSLLVVNLTIVPSSVHPATLAPPPHPVQVPVIVRSLVVIAEKPVAIPFLVIETAPRVVFPPTLKFPPVSIPDPNDPKDAETPDPICGGDEDVGPGTEAVRYIIGF